MFIPRTRIRARRRHTYCTPHYLGGDVVADNNADRPTRLMPGATHFDLTVMARAGGLPNRAVLGHTQFGPPAV